MRDYIQMEKRTLDLKYRDTDFSKFVRLHAHSCYELFILIAGEVPYTSMAKRIILHPEMLQF